MNASRNAEVKKIVIPHVEGNTTPKIAEALRSIVPGEKTLVSFEKGIYRCDREGSTEKEAMMAGLIQGVKHIVFDLENKSGVTIDGNGSEFIFTDRMTPFFLKNASGVTVKNLTVDFSFSRYCQGTLVALDDTGFELAIDRSVFGYSVDAAGHVIFSGGSESYSTEGEIAVLFANAVFGKPPWCYIFAGDTRADKSHLPVGYIETDAMETLRGIRFQYRPGSQKTPLTLGDQLLFNYEPRANINILIRDSRDVRIDNIRIYRGGGMGIVADHANDITIENTRIEVRPGRPECRSTTADGMYFTQCKGQVTVRGCAIQNTLDDALNIHGFYKRIKTVEAPHRLLAEDAYCEHRGSLPFDVGDCLKVCDGTTHREKGTVEISAARVNPDGTFAIELKEDVSNLSIGDLLENETRAADFLFEDNLVSCAPHIRISGNGHIQVRNNRFEKIQKILCTDLIAFWFESGAVQDLAIENNRFTDVPWAHNEDYPIVIDSTRAATSDVRHKNVKIIGNHFEKTDGRVCFVSRTDGITMEGNTFERLSGVEPIRTENCSDVNFF